MTRTDVERDRGDIEVARAEDAARGGPGKRTYVRRIFSEIAPRYDLLNRVLSLGIDRAWRRAAIDALEWRRRPGGAYLDLCAGTLDVAASLSGARGFAGFVVGADFAEPMLRSGARKVAGRAIAPVAGDAMRLPLRDASVDGAIVAFGIRNVADLDVALREVRRVLRPASRFVILEFSTPRSSIVRALYHLYFHHVLPVVGRLVSGHPTAYTYLPRSVASFPVEEELARRLTGAGFAAVRWRPLTLGIAAIHVGTA
jgi:demethylmenaquinone methyltransferase/2-methoxy-6-polyprenyl-1,4-benzoquinol methylase